MFAIISAAMTGKTDVLINVTGNGKVTDAATGNSVRDNGALRLAMYPFGMRALQGD